VKHGIAPMRAGGRVLVRAAIEGEALVLTVTDSGAVVPAAELDRRRGAGIGLSNLERRLERYYGHSASLQMRSTPDLGTQVTVSIALSAMRAGPEAEIRARGQLV
jgi:LytS/YehU family sensor histidine kinase